MKFLCLAYGGKDDCQAMNQQEQSEVLEQDEVLKSRGDFLATVQKMVVSVTNWNGNLTTENESFVKPKQPTLSICTLVDGEHEIQQLRGNQTIASSTFPGLKLTAEQVLRAGG